MEGLHKHKIHLSDGQKRKLFSAYKRQKPIVVGLTNEQLSRGKYNVLLTDDQHKAVSKAVKSNRGVRLTMNYNQLLLNKEGGLLKEMMDVFESTVPGGKRFISPLIRRRIAPLLKERFIPWIKNLIDSELDTIIEKDPKGNGLKRRINNKLDELLFANKKK